MIRKISCVSMFLTLSIFAAGISLAGETQTEENKQSIEPYVASFAYTPPAENKQNSQGTSFAVAKVSFTPCEVPSELWLNELKLTGKLYGSTGQMMWFAYPQFYNLPAKLRRDVAEILFAKGFRVRGPYESYEEIPPADKNAINFFIVPKFTLAFTLRDKSKRGYISTDIEANGTITLEVQNIKTREPLWTINVPLQKIAFASEIKMPYFADDKFNSIMNEVVKGIEQQYPALMKSISGRLDPQEIKALKMSGTGKTGY